MSLEPVTMGTMKTAQDLPLNPLPEPTEALMARDLAAWVLAKAVIAKARSGSGT